MEKKTNMKIFSKNYRTYGNNTKIIKLDYGNYRMRKSIAKNNFGKLIIEFTDGFRQRLSCHFKMLVN